MEELFHFSFDKMGKILEEIISKSNFNKEKGKIISFLNFKNIYEQVFQVFQHGH